MYPVCKKGKVAHVDVAVPTIPTIIEVPKMTPVDVVDVIEVSKTTPVVVPVTPEVSDRYYVITTTKYTWEEAVDACAESGDHLTSVTSEAETNNVNDVLNRAFPNAKKEKFWIGLNELASEDTWMWTDRK